MAFSRRVRFAMGGLQLPVRVVKERKSGCLGGGLWKNWCGMDTTEMLSRELIFVRFCSLVPDPRRPFMIGWKDALRRLYRPTRPVDFQ